MTAEDVSRWIETGELWKFYTCRAWKRLRREVMDEHHNECQDCKEKGKYKRAVMVHHEKPLRERPDLALMKYYMDEQGRKHRQLTPLCDLCHEARHPERLKQNKKENEPWPERWD